MVRTLYSGNRNASSWAFRAWLALKEQGIPFEEKIIDIRRPQRWENLHYIGTFSPPAAVPVLVDGEHVIFDSLAIMEYASELGTTSLWPEDIHARAIARSFTAWQHSTFGRVCASLSFESSFYPNKKTLSADELSQLHSIYALWDETVGRFGGNYLIGEFSIADIMLTPSVIRFSTHLAPDDRWPNTARWFEHLLNRPYIKQWLEEAYLEEPIYLPGYRNDP